MSDAHWGNWQGALQALRTHSGDWWLVTPFLTRGDAIPEPSRTRILTTLPIHKLATNNLQGVATERTLVALARLLESGAEIRLLDSLHAKVYLRRTGPTAVGFQGSANLTGKALENEEVMSNLIAFDTPFLQHLDRLWDVATKLTHAELHDRREQARQEREQLAAFAGLVPDVVVFVLDREYGLGSFALTNRRLGLPENEQENGYTSARVDFIRRKRTKRFTNIVSRGLDRLLARRQGQLPAEPPLARWLTNTNNMFAAHRSDANLIRRALDDIQEELQQAAEALGRDCPELLDDFLGRLRTWMSDRNVEEKLQLDIEREAHASYVAVILGGRVQLRYTELVARWPEENHPWRHVLTQMLTQTQIRLLENVRNGP